MEKRFGGGYGKARLGYREVETGFKKAGPRIGKMDQNVEWNNANTMPVFCTVFVFRPSEPRPLFTQKAVCSGKVQRSVFTPRDEPLDSCDEKTQWLNRSRLYFLTENMVRVLNSTLQTCSFITLLYLSHTRLSLEYVNIINI